MAAVAAVAGRGGGSRDGPVAVAGEGPMAERRLRQRLPSAQSLGLCESLSVR